jgi:hypothetical protein
MTIALKSLRLKKEVLILLLALSVLGPVAGVGADLTLPSGPPTPLTLDKKKVSVTKVMTIPFGTERLIDGDTAFNLNQVISMRPGTARTWLMTSGGLLALNKDTNLWGFSTEIDPDKVRPRELLLDDQEQNLWLYGEDLYRYEVKTDVIERWGPVGHLRRVETWGERLVYLTDRGLGIIDVGSQSFLTAGSHPLVFEGSFRQVAAEGNHVFVLRDDRALVTLTFSGGTTLSVTVSASLPEDMGDIRSLFAVGGKLWLLGGSLFSYDFTNKKIESYGISPRSMAPSGNKLLLAFNSGSSVFDTSSEPANPPRNLRENYLPVAGFAGGRAIVLDGMSYAYSVGTGFVLAYAVDPSKGWDLSPLVQIHFGGHQVLDIQSSSEDLWARYGDGIERLVPSKKVRIKYTVRQKMTDDPGPVPFDVDEQTEALEVYEGQ